MIIQKLTIKKNDGNLVLCIIMGSLYKFFIIQAIKTIIYYTSF